MFSQTQSNSTERSFAPLAIWAIWLSVALLLNFGPRGIPQLVESLTLQAAGVGLQTVDAVVGHPSTTKTSTGHPQELERLLAANRALSQQVATLQEQLANERRIPQIPTAKPEALVHSQALTAHVLGAKSSVNQQSADILISLGQQHGLLGEELVLSGEGILIDAGSEKGLAADQLVREGAALFGRTRSVGRYTALVQPVTDRDFQMGVRLVRQSPLGPVWGATGILVGTGDACEIQEIPATEPVAVGDHVYTQPGLTTSSQLVYCGIISSVSLNDSDTHWTIHVTPAAKTHSLPETLSVITSELNLR